MKRLVIFWFCFIAMTLTHSPLHAQTEDDEYYSKQAMDGEFEQMPIFVQRSKCVYQGDTITWIILPTVYKFPPMKFKSKKEMMRYNKLVYNVKKVLPIAKRVNMTVAETYEFLQTLQTKKEKDAHIKQVEKGIKKQYTPEMKKLTYSQGKLLIKLVNRECNQTSYELVKAFMGPLKAGFYQAFASIFGASLKKGYDPETDDRMVERVVLMVESGAL